MIFNEDEKLNFKYTISAHAQFSFTVKHIKHNIHAFIVNISYASPTLFSPLVCNLTLLHVYDVLPLIIDLAS